MCEIMVWKWVTNFQEGDTNVHDESCTGFPSTVIEEIVDTVQEKILKDCWDYWVKIFELCEFSLSKLWHCLKWLKTVSVILNCGSDGCRKS